MSTNWIVKHFDDLSASELYAALALREEVFVLEQQCLYRDLDGLDQRCFHLLGWQGTRLVAYCRLMPAGLKYAEASIGRVVTPLDVRAKGHGRMLMRQALRFMGQYYPFEDVVISAQQYLENFYTSFGFVTESEPYDEDGIPHIQMRWKEEF